MNNIDFHGIEEIWSSLSTSSLLWLTVTLAAYLFAQKLYKWSNWNSLLNPVAVSIVTVVILLMATHTPYQTYFSGAQFIHFLLGPTTVALAVPLYDLRIQLAKNWLPILLGLFAGAVTAITSTVLIAGLPKPSSVWRRRVLRPRLPCPSQKNSAACPHSLHPWWS